MQTQMLYCWKLRVIRSWKIEKVSDLDITYGFSNKDDKMAKSLKDSVSLFSFAYISVWANTRLK